MLSIRRVCANTWKVFLGLALLLGSVGCEVNVEVEVERKSC